MGANMCGEAAFDGVFLFTEVACESFRFLFDEVLVGVDGGKVSFEVLLGGKRFVAHRALVRFLLGVRRHVPCQIALDAKAPVADGTCMWSLVVVHAHVIVEVAPSGKNLVASGARKVVGHGGVRGVCVRWCP